MGGEPKAVLKLLPFWLKTLRYPTTRSDNFTNGAVLLLLPVAYLLVVQFTAASRVGSGFFDFLLRGVYPPL